MHNSSYIAMDGEIDEIESDENDDNRVTDPTSSSQLIPTNDSWKRQDVLLVLLVVMVKFGDAVELYLPGAITQVKSD